MAKLQHKYRFFKFPSVSHPRGWVAVLGGEIDNGKMGVAGDDATE